MGVIDEKEMERANQLYSTALKSYPELGEKIIEYINLQLNDFSRLGKLNPSQFASILINATKGLYILIYCNNYKEGERMINKQPIYSAAYNYMFIMMTRVLNGNDWNLALEEIRAKQQINIQK